MASFDDNYKQTKLLKQGIKKLEYPFDALVKWIKENYHANVLNIYYDYILPDNQPRLMIVLDRYDETNIFRGGSGHPYNFNAEKQKNIGEKFKDLVEAKSIEKNHKNLNPFINERDLFVAFDSFETDAKEEANAKIPEEKIAELKENFAHLNIWEIYREFDTVTFFFHVTTQVYSKTKICFFISPAGGFKKNIVFIHTGDKFRFFGG